MINIKNLDLNKMRIDENSYRNIPLYVNPLYLIINKINGYTGESNGNNYITLVPTYESKQIIKNMRNCGVKAEI